MNKQIFKFLLDEFIQFLICITIIAYFMVETNWDFWGWIFSILAALPFGYLCRHLLLFPMDIVLGRKSLEAFFSKQFIGDTFEFSRKKCYSYWVFYYGRNKKETLLFPCRDYVETAKSINIPSNGQKVYVEYYRLTKIISRYHVFE